MMMQLKDKLILIDCDGVMLDFMYGFHKWMTESYDIPRIYPQLITIPEQYNITKGQSYSLVVDFFESEDSEFLPPVGGAVYWMRELYEKHGYVFKVISNAPKFNSFKRERNLHRVFNPNYFDGIHCNGMGNSKHDLLLPFKDSNCWFIDDHVKNIVVAESLGLRTIQFNEKLCPWETVYNIITYAKEN